MLQVLPRHPARALLLLQEAGPDAAASPAIARPTEPLCRVSSPKRVLRSPQAQEHHGDRRHWLLHPGFSCAAFCNGYMYLYGCEHQCRPRRIQGFFVDRQGHSCSSCYWRLVLLSLLNHRALGRRVQPRVLRYYRSRQQDHRHDGTPG